MNNTPTTPTAKRAPARKWTTFWQLDLDQTFTLGGKVVYKKEGLITAISFTDTRVYSYVWPWTRVRTFELRFKRVGAAV